MASANEITYQVMEAAGSDSSITFEIPSNNDLEHIKNLDNLTSLLHRILPSSAILKDGEGFVSSDGSLVHKDQISGSVVLNLADLKPNGLYEFLFGDTDVQTIINCLWIGIVSSLIILSIIFIIFSCYFYKKFKEWKKCNKDIRSQLGETRMNGGTSESDYYQIESPPCYTIASGLPTYDEALKHTHFSFERKSFEPSFLAGVNVFFRTDYFMKTHSLSNVTVDSGSSDKTTSVVIVEESKEQMNSSLLNESTDSSTGLLTDIVVVS
ncbi:hypothetical protein ACFFRR_010483 [Megaselia abdita]